MSIGWLRISALIIPYFIIVGTFQFIGVLITGVDYTNFDAIKTSNQKLIVVIANLVGTFLVLWIFMKFVDKERFINLGFDIKNRLKDFNVGIGLGAFIMFIGYVILITINQIYFEKYNFNPSELLISFSIYIIVAIAEESLFRGYILKNFMLSFNKFIALILSSLFFSLAHAANPNFDFFAFINLFIAGILLGISYIFTKNLWFPIALHFSWNFSQTHFGFNVSGQKFYSLIEFGIKEKNILNGGDFGFEGSIFSTIFQIICVILIHNYYSKIEINN